MQISSTYGSADGKEKKETFIQFDNLKKQKNEQEKFSPQAQNYKDGVMMELLKQYINKHEQNDSLSQKINNNDSNSSSLIKNKEIIPILRKETQEINRKTDEPKEKYFNNQIFPKCHDFLNNYSFEMLVNFNSPSTGSK